MKVLMRSADTASVAWGPGGQPGENRVLFLLGWLQAGLLTVVMVQEPDERDFWSGPKPDLLLLLLFAPGKKSMLL